MEELTYNSDKKSRTVRLSQNHTVPRLVLS